MPVGYGKRLRSWFTIEGCSSPSTYWPFTPASWPQCGVRSRRARLAHRGSRPSARSGRSFAASLAYGLTATTFFSTTTRQSRARRYFATSVSRSSVLLKLRARCTRCRRRPPRPVQPHGRGAQRDPEMDGGESEGLRWTLVGDLRRSDAGSVGH